MYCSKCAHLIDDNAKFCPFCGNRIQQQNDSAAPSQGFQPPVNSVQPAPVQPAYQPAVGAPYVQPAVKSAVPSGGSGRSISKGGFIVSVILSAAALGLWLVTLIEDTGYLIEGLGYFGTYMDFAYLFLCFIPLFVLCLNLKKINPMMLGFTFAIIILYRLLGVISSVANVEIFGVSYYYDTVGIVFFLTLTAGVALYIVAMANQRGILGLKIAAAVLLGVTAVFHVYEFFANAFDWMEDVLYFIGYLGYAFAIAAALASLIVVLFTSKKQAAAASAPAVGYAPAAAPVSVPSAPAAPAAKPAPAPAEKPVSNAVDTLRVYLDIDKLDSGVYGHKAGLVIAQAVSADLLEGMTIESGDSRATLYGSANEYVVSIRGRSSALDEIEQKMHADAAFEGYLSSSGLRRGNGNEPLVGDGTVRGGALTGGGFSWCAKGMEEGWKK